MRFLSKMRCKMTTILENILIPTDKHRADIERAVKILSEEGCQEIYIFGSIATGTADEQSDIDLGIRHYPRERFYHIYGRLLTELDHQMDLVDFEHQTKLFNVLTDIGEVKRIG